MSSLISSTKCRLTPNVKCHMCILTTDPFVSELTVYTVRLHVVQHTVLRKHFCPSVCLSVKCIDCDKKRNLCPVLIPHERSFIL